MPYRKGTPRPIPKPKPRPLGTEDANTITESVMKTSKWTPVKKTGDLEIPGEDLRSHILASTGLRNWAQAIANVMPDSKGMVRLTPRVAEALVNTMNDAASGLDADSTLW